jgi:hypothetical protein
MMAFTADGQMDPAALQVRDRLLGVNTDKIRDSRKDWADNKPTPHPAADHPWRTGGGGVNGSCDAMHTLADI